MVGLFGATRKAHKRRLEAYCIVFRWQLGAKDRALAVQLKLGIAPFLRVRVVALQRILSYHVFTTFQPPPTCPIVYVPSSSREY
jgi:hypothetical protein